MSKYFQIQELVPPGIYTLFGEKAWWFVSQAMVAVIDALRDDLGQPIIVNDWSRGGSFQYSGYRPPECRIGAKYSMHRMGLAFDVKAKGKTPAEILAVIMANKQKYLDLGLTTYEHLEDTPTWLHLDGRRWLGKEPQTEFMVVKPS